MLLYSHIESVESTHFNQILAGAFFQMERNGFDKLFSISKKEYEKVLLIDILQDINEDFACNLALKERMMMYESLGVKHLFCVSRKDFFSKIFSRLQRLLTNSAHSEIHLLSGLQERRIVPQSFVYDLPAVFNKEVYSEICQRLGYYFFLYGRVVHGNQIGRTLGFPTANIIPDDVLKTILPKGVYAGMVKYHKHWYPAMINIGIRPTLDLENVTIEAHILDFSADLYGRELGLHFIEYIRPEMRFPSLDILKKQLHEDKTVVENILKKRNFKLEEDNVLISLLA